MKSKNYTLVFLLLGLTISGFAQFEDPVQLYDFQSDTINLEQHFSVVDTDNDGFNDILFSRYNSTFGMLDLQLMKGDGYSNFSLPDSITSVFGAFVSEYFVSDINGDGNQDVIFTYQFYSAPYEKGIGWYFGMGDGTLNPMPNGIPLPNEIFQVSIKAIEDFDEDGDKDLLFLILAENQQQEMVGNLSIAFNNGFGVFNSTETISESPIIISASDIKLGDLNGDDKLDIISVTSLGPFSVVFSLLNSGDNTFQDSVIYLEEIINGGFTSFNYVSIDIHDMNGDGTDEIFLSTQKTDGCFVFPIHCEPEIEREYSVLDFNINTEEIEIVSRINSWPHSFESSNNFRLEYADFNMDGNIDILTRVSSGQLKWLEGDGIGNFLTEHTVATGFSWQSGIPSLKAVDMDLDSDLDIIIVNFGYDGKDVWYIENLEFQPDHDEDGIIVDEDCDDSDNQIGDTLIIEGLLPTYEICEGKAFQFLINNASAELSYQWNGPAGYIETVPEPIIEDIALADAGNYTIQSSNLNCTSAMLTTELIVGAYPEVSISEDGNILTAESDDAVSFQWYLNGNEISGEDQVSYTATESGEYTVVVASVLGCETTSVSVNMVISDVFNQNNHTFKMYPNPVKINGLVQLKFSNEATFPVTISVFNNKGQIVLQEEVKTIEHNIFIENVSAGFYSMQIMSKNGTSTKKFIVVN